MSYNCPKCGTPFTPGAKFCQSCGTNLESVASEKMMCPQCQTTYPPGSIYCSKDGAKLVRQQDLAVPPYQGFQAQNQTTPQYNFQKQAIPAYDYTKYPKASLGNRFVAALLDGLISLGLSIPAIAFFIAGVNGLDSYGSRRDMGAVYIFLAFVFYLIPLVYGFIKDGLGQGQSWGKKPMNLMVVNLENNSPCTRSKSFVRNLISVLTGVIPFVGWLIEPIMVLATEDGRKLGDKAANTQVIDTASFKAQYEFDSI
ncbi:MAG: RDD family protein [Bacteroidetes bacterium]|nr:RDD family protein [Bacteroidota bacterium]